MDQFLTAFWPNAAATLSGIILGLPTALWVNRIALRSAEHISLKSQIQRLDHALEVLISSMNENRTILGAYSKVVAESKVRWCLNLNISAWDAIKADFMAEHTAPSLRGEVAYHFSQLSALVNLNQQYLGFAFGTNASMSGSEKTRESISTNLKGMCEALDVQAGKLTTSLQQLHASLPTD